MATLSENKAGVKLGNYSIFGKDSGAHESAVESLLSCYDRFCVWAEKRLKKSSLDFKKIALTAEDRRKLGITFAASPAKKTQNKNKSKKRKRR